MGAIASHWSDKGREQACGLEQGDLPTSAIGVQLWLLLAGLRCSPLGVDELLFACFSWVAWDQHILPLPDLGTTTIPAHHLVGSVTLEIISAFSRSSDWRGRRTCRGVKIACGLHQVGAGCCTLLSEDPRPWNIFGNHFLMSSVVIVSGRSRFWWPSASLWLLEVLAGYFWVGQPQRLDD